jgi:hypothetical protein
MPLINCTDCGRQVSDRAAICPQCSAPIASTAAPAPAPSGSSAVKEGESAPHVCIHCGATDLTFAEDRQGFGAGKAFVGAMALGPYGLLAGAINRKKSRVLVRCNRCFKQFDAAEMVARAATGTKAGTKAPYKCPKCGGRSATWSKHCSACGAKMPSKTAGLVGRIVFCLFVVLLARACIGSTSTDAQAQGSAGKPLAAASTSGPAQASVNAKDDLDLLIKRYGKPDEDDSTLHDNPRPPIVTRFLRYKKENVKVAYVYQGDGTWKFLAFADARSGKPITPEQAVDRMKKRDSFK